MGIIAQSLLRSPPFLDESWSVFWLKRIKKERNLIWTQRFQTVYQICGEEKLKSALKEDPSYFESDYEAMPGLLECEQMQRIRCVDICTPLYFGINSLQVDWWPWIISQILNNSIKSTKPLWWVLLPVWSSVGGGSSGRWISAVAWRKAW